MLTLATGQFLLVVMDKGQVAEYDAPSKLLESIVGVLLR